MSTSYHSQRDRSLRGFFSAQVMNVNPLAFEMSNFSQKSTDMSRSVRIHAIKMRWAFLGPTYCLLRSYLYLYTYGVIFFNASGLHYSRHFIRGKARFLYSTEYIHTYVLVLARFFFSPDLLDILCFQHKKNKENRSLPFWWKGLKDF